MYIFKRILNCFYCLTIKIIIKYFVFHFFFRGDSISITELSIDIAQPNNEDLSTTTLSSNDFDVNNIKNNIAIGVEVCHSCSKEYTSLSCQNPAVGYYRHRPGDFLNDPDDAVLVGISVLCKCNNHSNVCDSETGRCNVNINCFF